MIFYCIFIHKPRKAPTRNPNLIVSLTSYPGRMKTIHICLFGLIRQTEIPNLIVLWLAEEEWTNKNIPFFVRLLTKRGITVLWTDKNLKSYNKLLPSLKTYPNDIIVVCDDDSVYHRNWLKELYAAHLETPNIVVGHRGLFLSKKNETQLDDWNDMIQIWFNDLKCAFDPKKIDIIREKYNTPAHKILLEGYRGILFPPHIFSDEIHNESQFLTLCPFADDIWFNAMLMLRGIKKRAISSPFYSIPRPLYNSQEFSLYAINILQNKNNEQFKKVFDAYKLYKFID